jgi:hypothetical protein
MGSRENLHQRKQQDAALSIFSFGQHLFYSANQSFMLSVSRITLASAKSIVRSPVSK